MKKTLLALAVVAIGFASCSKNVASTQAPTKEMMLDTINQILSSHEHEYEVSQELRDMSFPDLLKLSDQADKDFSEITEEFNRNNSPGKARVVRSKALKVLGLIHEAMKRPECTNNGDTIPGASVSLLLSVVKERQGVLQNQELKALADTREAPRQTPSYTPRTDWDSDDGPMLRSDMQDEINRRIQYMNSIDRSPSGSYYAAQARATYINPYGNIR